MRLRPFEGARVTHVYIDPSAMSISSAGATSATPAAPLDHLLEAGMSVTLLGTPPAVDPFPAGVEVGGTLPDALAADDWFLTGTPYPESGRPRGGRTVLVGPRLAPGPIPLPRYDVEARDLAAAVMEILTRQAMA